jgi:hypothetical protein
MLPAQALPTGHGGWDDGRGEKREPLCVKRKTAIGLKLFLMNNAKTRGRRPEVHPCGTLRTCGPEVDKVRRKKSKAFYFCS